MAERNLTTVALAVVGRSGRSKNKRETYQLTLGGEGHIADYDYDFSIQQGRVNSQLASQDLLNSRYYEALDATTDADGNAICRSGNPDCVAYNPINNQASAQALDYAAVTLLQNDSMAQTVASFSLKGDWIELPAGTAAFAVGAGYRKETSHSDPDPLTQAIDADGVGAGLVGTTTGASRIENIYLNPVAGSYSVVEVFGEAIIPLLADVTAVKALDLELAALYADHSSTGGDLTYRSALNWALNQNIRLRYTYSHAVRAPNIEELFKPNQISGQFVTDPCDNTHLAQGRYPANRQANCAALGLAGDFQSEASFGTRNISTKGNIELKAEKADTATVGIVYTPTSRLSIAIDYWNVAIKDAITSFDPTDVLNNCVDGATLDDTFCDLVIRDGNGQIDNIAVQNINAAKFSANGVDLDINYGVELSGAGLNFSLYATYLDERQFQQNTADPTDADNAAGEVGFPHFRALISSSYVTDNFSASWRVNYIGQTTFNKNAQPETYPDWFDNQVARYANHNLHFGYNLSDSVKLYLGVNNVGDKKPPNLPQLNAGGLLHDAIGRRYYGGVNVAW